MFAQTLAFLTRSIRQESRLLTHHIVRGALVLLTLMLFFIQVLEAPRRSASGLFLVQNISNCCYFCLTLLGIMYFAVAITEEKEEETLPLLRMTGVRNFTLLIGKSVPRLAVVALLILVSTPFLLLATALGGVVPEQIIATVLGMICYAFCLSQLGLLCSTISRNSQRAGGLMFVLWILLEFGSWLFSLFAFGCRKWDYLGLQYYFNKVSEFLWQRSMWNASGDFLMFERDETIWQPQMTFQLLVGLGFFGLSWIMFEPCNQAALAQGAASGEYLARGIFTRSRLRKSLRSWDAALAWKSWQFNFGGWLWFILLTITLPGLTIGIAILISLIVGEFPSPELYGILLIVTGIGGTIGMLMNTFSKVLNREIYQQTLVSLCMLPHTRGTLLKRMYAGLLPALVPPLMCLLLGIFWTALAEPSFVRSLFDTVIEPWFWFFVAWLFVTAHVGLLLSVNMRYGGMFVAIALCCIIFPFVLGMVISLIGMMLSFLFRGGNDFFLEALFRYLLPIVLIMGEVAICGLIHKLVLDRVERVAGQ